MSDRLDTKSMSCGKLAEAGKMLIEDAKQVANQYAMWDRSDSPLRGLMKKFFADMYRMLKDMFTEVRFEYGRRPCGSGNLEADIGTFPPLPGTPNPL